MDDNKRKVVVDTCAVMNDNSVIDNLLKENYQVIKEVYSSYLYMAFANYFREKGLKGFEHWYDIQAKEELDHAKMFIKYLHNKE